MQPLRASTTSTTAARNRTRSNHVPDVVGKVAYEAKFAGRDVHLEGFGLYRDHLYAIGEPRNRIDERRLRKPAVNTTASNHDTTGYGVGGGRHRARSFPNAWISRRPASTVKRHRQLRHRPSSPDATYTGADGVGLVPIPESMFQALGGLTLPRDTRHRPLCLRRHRDGAAELLHHECSRCGGLHRVRLRRADRQQHRLLQHGRRRHLRRAIQAHLPADRRHVGQDLQGLVRRGPRRSPVFLHASASCSRATRPARSTASLLTAASLCPSRLSQANDQLVLTSFRYYPFQ